MIIVLNQKEEGAKDYILESYPRMSAVSDGYHSFGELYQYRMLLQALLFNEWAIGDAYYDERQDKGKYHQFNVHKSWRHSDGELCFGKDNYFVVVATLPTGQITNHYKGQFWDLFKIPEHDRADKWDAHTPQQAADRMEQYLKERKI